MSSRFLNGAACLLRLGLRELRRLGGCPRFRSQPLQLGVLLPASACTAPISVCLQSTRHTVWRVWQSPMHTAGCRLRVLHLCPRIMGSENQRMPLRGSRVGSMARHPVVSACLFPVSSNMLNLCVDTVAHSCTIRTERADLDRCKINNMSM